MPLSSAATRKPPRPDAIGHGQSQNKGKEYQQAVPFACAPFPPQAQACLRRPISGPSKNQYNRRHGQHRETPLERIHAAFRKNHVKSGCAGKRRLFALQVFGSGREKLARRTLLC